MLRGIGSSVIPVIVLLALLFIVLPGSAANNATQTTVATTETTTAPPTTTVITTQTTTAPPATTVATTQTTNATTTTAATAQTTTVAVTLMTTVVPSANPTVTVTETETTGSVMVYSSPTGASILIDGIYVGTTPGNVNGVPAGNHILRLSLSGYYDYEGSIYIVPGQNTQGYGTLQPMNQVTSATPVPTAIVPVIIPVVTAEPAQDKGLLGNSSVIAAIIGAIAVIIGSAVTIFTHIKPPKKV
jgi:hypothetical protein